MRQTLAALVLAILAVLTPAHAQESWPQRQVTIVVPFSAGGTTDMFGRIFEAPEVQKNLTEVGAVPSPMTPEQFIAFIAAERRKWQEVIQAAGVQAQ